MRKMITCLALATLCLALPMSASAGVLAHWSFDETTHAGTTFADSSGNGYNGTIGGAGSDAWLDAEGKFTTGGGGLSTAGFEMNDGGSGQVPQFNASLTQTDFTFATWFNTDQLSQQQALFGNWGGAGYSFLFQVYSSRLYIGVRNASNVDIVTDFISADGDLSQDTWHHIAITWDRDTKTMLAYIDGTQVGSKVSTQTDIDIKAVDQDYWIGRARDGKVADANFDEMWVFDQALTVGEVSSLMTSNVVPEPATMSLLALGGIAMLKRRKRK